MRKISMLYAAILICMLQLSSCISSETIQGSFDVSNEHEGGVSKLKNANDVGYNVGLEFLIGLDDVGTSPIPVNTSGDPISAGEIYPLEYNPRETSAPSGKFMLGTT